jgi:hypothetical protein
VKAEGEGVGAAVGGIIYRRELPGERTREGHTACAGKVNLGPEELGPMN